MRHCLQKQKEIDKSISSIIDWCKLVTRVAEELRGGQRHKSLRLGKERLLEKATFK